MAIFTPSKNGDVMGSWAYQRMTQKQRVEFGKKKREEEERATNQDYYKTKRLAAKFEETAMAQRKAVGL